MCVCVLFVGGGTGVGVCCVCVCVLFAGGGTGVGV